MSLIFFFTIKSFLWNLKIKSILVIGSKAFSPFYHNRLLLKKVFSMHFSITLYTLYVAYSFIHRLRYVMYIGYIEYTNVYLVWTYQLKPILCISNIILYVYMQICSVIRRFFLCVCSAKWDWVNRLCLNFFLHRTNYILLRWPGLLRELKWNLNKPKFFLYWNLSTDKFKFIIY